MIGFEVISIDGGSNYNVIFNETMKSFGCYIRGMFDNNFSIPLFDTNNNRFPNTAPALPKFFLRMLVAFLAANESFIYFHFSVKLIGIRRFFGLFI